MAKSEFISVREAAGLLGFTTPVLYTLMEAEKVLHWERRSGYYTFRRQDILDFRRDMPFSPNDLIVEDGDEPLFARHDDGRWWLIISYEEARQAHRYSYFEGTACEARHRVERYTEEQTCFACEKLEAKLRRRKNSSASTGCNLP